MRVVFAAVLLLSMSVFAVPSARADPAVTMADPSTYAATIARQMTTEDLAPLRATFVALSGDAQSQLPVRIETSLVTFERAIGHREARITRQIEDVLLADTVRHIYYYHYYGENAWVFTRFEFVRISDQRWALSALSFSSSWSEIFLGATPSFRQSETSVHP